MSARHIQSLLAVLTLALVCALVLMDRDNLSPGPLSAAHQVVPELAGSNCVQCHGETGHSMAEACLACHGELTDQIAGGRGFHGLLETPDDCAHCHAEHLGNDLSLVGARAFALAGVPDPEAYDHRGLHFELLGRHLELTCQDCHGNADVEVLPPGEHRFLGLRQDCAACHEDPHGGAMVKSCQECHGQTGSFQDLGNFRHTAEFPLEGVHGGLSCTDCHEPGTDYAVESLGSLHSPDKRECADCHRSPHTMGFLEGVAEQLEVQPAATCTPCHSSRGTLQSFARPNEAATTRLHGASGFALVPPHASLACSECHTPGEVKNRQAQDCAACHANPHGEQFATGPFQDSSCSSCHDALHFSPSLVGPELHAVTGFLLEAAHSTPRCEACHDPGPERSLGSVNFTVADPACIACHQDVHGDGFQPDLQGTDDCARCHRPTDFSDVDRGEFDHGTWTGFALSGAHGSLECEACHRPGSTPQVPGRSFGRILSSAGARVDACANCHANVHVGPMAQAAEDCDRCHTTNSFDQVRPGGFHHGRDAGFELEGAHGQLTCVACHLPLDRPKLHGRELGFAPRERAASDCRSCHQDPHDGFFVQHTQNGRTFSPQCSECHGQESFEEGSRTGFAHAIWTGFPLEGAHARARCVDCHGTGAEGTLGTVQGNRCSDCHQDEHRGQLGETGCARCHASTESFREITFDHRYDSRFPLDENHQDLACARCHQPWPLASGGTTIRYKPLGTECIDCHRPGEVK